MTGILPTATEKLRRAKLGLYSYR